MHSVPIFSICLAIRLAMPFVFFCSLYASLNTLRMTSFSISLSFEDPLDDFESPLTQVYGVNSRATQIKFLCSCMGRDKTRIRMRIRMVDTDADEKIRTRKGG